MENNLLKRGIVKADWCCMCKSSGETVSICCCTVQWPMICGVFFFFSPFFCAVGISWVMLDSVKSMMESWSGMMRRHSSGTVWGEGQSVFYGAFGEKEINGYLRGRTCLY